MTQSKNHIKYPMSLGTSVNHHKNGILLAYISNKILNIHLRKLLKIVYLIDEYFMYMRGFPLTWFDYYAWAKGPVAPEVYAIKENAFSDFVSLKRDENGKCIVNSLQPHEFLIYKEMNEFSESEISAIDKLLADFKDKSADELSDITHVPESLWSRIVVQNRISFEAQKTSDFQIPLSMLFEDGDYRIEVFEDAKWNMEYQAMLNEKRLQRNVSPVK